MRSVRSGEEEFAATDVADGLMAHYPQYLGFSIMFLVNVRRAAGHWMQQTASAAVVRADDDGHLSPRTARTSTAQQFLYALRHLRIFAFLPPSGSLS